MKKKKENTFNYWLKIEFLILEMMLVLFFLIYAFKFYGFGVAYWALAIPSFLLIYYRIREYKNKK